MKRKMLLFYFLIITISLSATIYGIGNSEKTNEINSPADKILLGKSLFMDSNLSEPAGQSCVSCHSFGAGLADPDQAEATSRGVDPSRFGSRNTPMAAYAAFTPEFHYDKEEELYVGGQFLDGRASSLEDQAKLPFLNELEMNNPDEDSLVEKVRESAYADLFKSVYGEKSLDNPKQALDHMADAIAEFERTDVFAPFTSKFDYVQTGKAQFTKQEARGFDLFNAEDKGNCAACHPAEVDEGKVLFTDFTYDNLGAPANANNSFNTLDKTLNPDGKTFADKGLGSGENKAVLKKDLAAQLGKFRVPSLRNVAITPPYNHNGVFVNLKEVVDFYNSRDVVGAVGFNNNPEIAENVNTEELGDLKLSDQEVLDIVAFMETLTDGYTPEKIADASDKKDDSINESDDSSDKEDNS